MKTWDAVIAGAGPAGSATAILLSRQGLSVLLVDRQRFPREKPCADYLAPGAMKVLDGLGVGQDLRADGHPIGGMQITASGGAVVTGRFRSASGLAIPRRDLDARLVDRAIRCGAVLREGHSFDRVVSQRGVQIVALRGPSPNQRVRVHTRLLVGADGLHSRVARSVGGQVRGGERRLALVAHLEGVTGLQDLGEMIATPRGYVGFAPFSDGSASVSVVMPTRLFRKGASRNDVFWEELTRPHHVYARVRNARQRRSVLAAGPFGVRNTRLVGDGIVLVGDAAYFFDPFTGEGVTAALVGAELVARVAARCLSSPHPITARSLRPYRTAHHRAFAGRWFMQRTIAHAVSHPWLLNRVIRRLRRRPDAASHLVRMTGGLEPALDFFRPRSLAAMVL